MSNAQRTPERSLFGALVVGVVAVAFLAACKEEGTPPWVPASADLRADDLTVEQ